MDKCQPLPGSDAAKGDAATERAAMRCLFKTVKRRRKAILAVT